MLVALMILLVHLLIARELLLGSRKIPFLKSVRAELHSPLPRLSIIAAARNEESKLRPAARSLLQQDYPDLEVIIVNDRSDDQTGTILGELARDYPQLTVLQIDQLPTGWLGKNHALWQGAQQASGNWLLFTDADVVMAPDTLSRALTFARQQRLDHLAASPEVQMPGHLLNAFGLTFGLFFALFTRPWRAPDPASRRHIGIGAFNLVRTECYRQIGGHRPIALRPDDDLRLGQLIKRAGYRQQLIYGTGFIKVEWYSSVSELVRGLEKNLFAGTDYRVGLTLAGIIFNLVVFIWPWPALLISSGVSRWLYLTAVATMLLVAADSARRHAISSTAVALLPVTLCLFTGIIVRTLCLNLAQGGIHWRGTFYPLEELRKKRH